MAITKSKTLRNLCPYTFAEIESPFQQYQILKRRAPGGKGKHGLAASPEAYDLLRLAGAGYVVYLGLGCLTRLTPSSTAVRDAAALAATGSDRRWFARRLVTNLLNPKVGVLYVTLLPQFVPAGANAVVVCLALAAVHAAEGIVWFCALASMAQGLGGWLRGARVRACSEGLTGFVFIGFGVKLALQRGP